MADQHSQFRFAAGDDLGSFPSRSSGEDGGGWGFEFKYAKEGGFGGVCRRVVFALFAILILFEMEGFVRAGDIIPLKTCPPPHP